MREIGKLRFTLDPRNENRAWEPKARRAAVTAARQLEEAAKVSICLWKLEEGEMRREERANKFNLRQESRRQRKLSGLASRLVFILLQ